MSLPVIPVLFKGFGLFGFVPKLQYCVHMSRGICKKQSDIESDFESDIESDIETTGNRLPVSNPEIQ